MANVCAWSRSTHFLFFATIALILVASRLPAQQSERALSASSGQRIVHASCETCHSLAPGVTKIGPSLYGLLNGASPRSTPVEVKRIIRTGRKQMPSYTSVFTPEEFDSITLYLRDLP